MRASLHNFIQRIRHGSASIAIGNYIFAIVYAVCIILPFYYIVVSAFKDNLAIFGAPLSLPSSWDLHNFFEAQEKANLIRAMGISALIVIGAESLLLLFGFPAAYAIARIPTGLANIAEVFFGTGFLIPVFAVLVPIFLMAAATGLLYSPISLVFFYLAARLPLTVVVLASQMREIPSELEESAIIDGANRFQIMRHVIFPLARSGVATVLVLNFLFVWNEYLFALILLSDETRTVQVAVPLLKSERLVDYGLLAAGILISLVPVYIVFIIFQEQIVKGLLGGAVKG